MTKEDINPYFWRVFFIMPGFFSLIRVFLFTFVFTFDTPEYNMKMGNGIRSIELKINKNNRSESLLQNTTGMNMQKKFTSTILSSTKLGNKKRVP